MVPSIRPCAQTNAQIAWEIIRTYICTHSQPTYTNCANLIFSSCTGNTSCDLGALKCQVRLCPCLVSRRCGHGIYFLTAACRFSSRM